MLSTALSIDRALAQVTADPLRSLPRVVFLAASSTSPVVYSSARGYAHLPSTPGPLDELAQLGATSVSDKSVFELFSAGKLVTTIAALQLVDEGRLSLDDDARAVVTELAGMKRFVKFGEDEEPVLEENNEAITVRQLMTHTAGFTYGFFHPDLDKIADKAGVGASPYCAEATKEWLFKYPLWHRPGKRFQYGLSIDWLGLVIEAVSGLPLEEYLRKRIFRLLGIDDASFAPNPSQVSMAYTPPSANELYTFSPPPPMSTSHSFGGCGLKCSALSFVRILCCLLNGGKDAESGTQLLKPETVDLMFSPQLETEQQRKDVAPLAALMEPSGLALKGANFGLGGVLVGKGHSGGRGKGSLTWSGASNNSWVVDREHDIAFVVFSDVLPFPSPAVKEVWCKVEAELYKGLKEEK
ncbi:hypothetical protein JCM6882_005402 [Rhodosporidiobolus microsporus]